MSRRHRGVSDSGRGSLLLQIKGWGYSLFSILLLRNGRADFVGHQPSTNAGTTWYRRGHGVYALLSSQHGYSAAGEKTCTSLYPGLWHGKTGRQKAACYEEKKKSCKRLHLNETVCGMLAKVPPF